MAQESRIMAVPNLFDCDGVLVDSEIIALRILADCLNEAGFMVNLDQAIALGVGKSGATFAAAVEQELGRPLPATFLEDMR